MSSFHPKLLFSVFLLINLLSFYNNLSFNKPFYEFADQFQERDIMDNLDVRNPYPFDDLLVQLDITLSLLQSTDKEQSGSVLSISGFDTGLQLLILNLIGFTIATLGVGFVVVVTKKKRGPKRKKVPLKLVVDHLRHLRDTRKIITKRPKQESILEEEIDEKSEMELVISQIDEIYKLGAELFAEGEYLAVVNHYNQAALTILKYGYAMEAEKFSQRAKEIKDLIDLRNHKVTVLEIHRLGKKWKDVVLLYYEIIRLSKQLNDYESIERYQNELDHLDISQEPAEEKEVEITINSSIQDEMQKFAIRDLEKKRQKYEKSATFLEGKELFSSAAFFYKKCAAISEQMVRLGKIEERPRLKRYREKKVECANKNSSTVGETEVCQ
ncbi:MAG: hypothetical protein ACTSQI_21190 [Candidatus Helarchaeota archaeon]